MHTTRTRSLALSTAFVGLTMSLGSCGHPCDLGLHDFAMVTSDQIGPVPCCGGSTMKDIPLLPSTEGELDLSNIYQNPEPVDAFLVPTSCSKLFDGDYPGAHPLCQIYIGPVGAKGDSGRVKMNAGTYRVWMQAYSTNTGTGSFSVMIDILDYRCLPVLP